MLLAHDSGLLRLTLELLSLLEWREQNQSHGSLTHELFFSSALSLLTHFIPKLFNGDEDDDVGIPRLNPYESSQANVGRPEAACGYVIGTK